MNNPKSTCSPSRDGLPYDSSVVVAGVILAVFAMVSTTVTGWRICHPPLLESNEAKEK